ncbi:MAG: ubiquinone anaerobic biosynthesis accessory factor UbiT [Enterobacteriaceae bacterium]
MLKELKSRLINHGPALLSLPVKYTPFVMQQQVIQRLLSWQFNEALTEGELDFLQDRWLKVEVRDLGLYWFMSVQDNRLVVQGSAQPDVTFSGNANDLILIAARKEDPDTLFFQRRLKIEGDTELGLYVKNLMDSIDLHSMPTLLRVGLLKLADFIEEGLKGEESPRQTDEIISC